MWFAWVLLVWFFISILTVQGRVGAKTSGRPVTQGVANVATIIYLALAAGVVAFFL